MVRVSLVANTLVNQLDSKTYLLYRFINSQRSQLYFNEIRTKTKATNRFIFQKDK